MPIKKKPIMYTPESQLRNPGKMFSSMLKDLFASRELAMRLMIRNISAQYRQTLLGFLWVFLPPILTTLTFVFLNKHKILNVEIPEIPYAIYILSGTLLWQGFVDALLMPIKMVSNSKAMLSKVNFPREALILAGFGEVAFNFIIRMVILIIVFFFYSFKVPATICIAPLGWIVLLSLGVVIGIFFSPFGILYQDVERGLILSVSIWFFLTPIIYIPPTQWPASILVVINPVSPILIGTRELMLSGQMTSPISFIVVMVLTFLMLLFSWVLYRLSMPHLISRMSA